MGVCISYRGKLADPTSVDKMVLDLLQLSEKMGWKTWTIEEMVAQGHLRPYPLKGIAISVHPKCETVTFLVTEKGQFVNAFYYGLVHDETYRKETMDILIKNARATGQLVETKEEDEPPKGKRKHKGPDMTDPAFLKDGMAYNSIKTQFGGVSAHLAVCMILGFVKERYAPKMRVKDDTDYFKTGDLKPLQTQLAFTDALLDRFKSAIQKLNQEGTKSLETPKEMINRLIELFHEAKQDLH